MQGLVSDFGSCFKLCYVLLNNRESKAQLSFQTSSDLLAKIMENFQKRQEGIEKLITML